MVDPKELHKLTDGTSIFPVSSEGKSVVLNLLDMGSEIERVSLLAKMMDVPLSPEQEKIAVAVMKSLPASATLRDFLDACQVDSARRLGISLEALEALTPLLTALEAFGEPGPYGHLFDEYRQAVRDDGYSNAVQRLHDDLSK